jgi:hypothetical protein
MATAPSVHYWKAGDGVNAEIMNEVQQGIEWFRNPPLVHVTMASGSIALPATSWTSVTFTTAISDAYDMWDISDPDNINVTVPGWYTVEATISVSNVAATDARLTMALYKQNAELILRWDQQVNGNNGNINIHKETTMFLNTGDTLQLKVHVNAGARNIVTNGTNEAPQIRMRWVSN